MLTVADLDKCETLYVWKFPTADSKDLRFEIAEGTSFKTYETLENPRLFAVTWQNYLTYQVVNESATGGPDDYEIKSGRIFVRYERSHYMDYIRNDPRIRERYFDDFKPGLSSQLQHWAIYCLNHTIEVMAPDEPIIELLESPWENPAIVRQRFEEQLEKNRQESIEQTRRDRLKKT